MFCTDIPAPFFLVFSDTTPPLLYYAHIPAMLAALVLGLFVFSKTRTVLTRLLLWVIVLFSGWIVIDLIVWTNVDSRIIMVAWSVMNLVAVLIAAFLLYFSYVFLEERDTPLWAKALGALLILPMIVTVPTGWNIEQFDLAACEAVQSDLAVYYFYFLEATFLLWTFGYFLWRCIRLTDKKERRKTELLGGGVSFFLITFYGGSFVGSYFGNWEYEQYGLFGVFLFIGALIALIVRYGAFDIRMIGAQALVVSLVALIASQYFFVEGFVVNVLVSVTLVIAMGFGYVLIQSIANEIRRKNELQEMADRLAFANQELQRLDNAKSEFISIASHQLRTPLTAIKGYVSLLLEGTYGKISNEVEDVMNKVYSANGRLIELVDNLLNISRIESGRMQYSFEPEDLLAIVEDLRDTFSVIAKKKGLELVFVIPEHPLPKVTLDRMKIREIVSNLVDNAIKYTNKGSVTVSVYLSGEGKVRVAVKDSGIGIQPEDKDRLFNKFTRSKSTERIHVGGTGLGLYVGRTFAERHGGRLFVESAGPDQGSEFVLELPLEPPRPNELPVG